ncbi:hypothetical protein Tsubulata_037937, partial [Turnera subulata]
MGTSILLRLLSRCLQQLPLLKPLLISTLAATHLRSTEYHRHRMAMIFWHKRAVVGNVNGTGGCIVILVAWNWCFGRVMNCSRDVGCVEGCVNSTGRNPARFRQPREITSELGND